MISAAELLGSAGGDGVAPETFGPHNTLSTCVCLDPPLLHSQYRSHLAVMGPTALSLPWGSRASVKSRQLPLLGSRAQSESFGEQHD